MRNQGVRWRHRLRTGAGRPNTTLASSNPSIRRFSMLPPPDCFQQQAIMHERNFGFATKPHETNLRNHQEDTPEDYVAIESLAANTVGGFKILVKFTCSDEAVDFSARVDRDFAAILALCAICCRNFGAAMRRTTTASSATATSHLLPRQWNRQHPPSSGQRSFQLVIIMRIGPRR